MMHRMPITTVVLLVAGSLGAAAQQPTQPSAQALRAACRADFQHHCPAVSPSDERAMACLRQHEADLSGGCRDALASAGRPARGRMARLRQACGSDYHAHCRGVPLAGGEALACLQQHQSELTGTCRSALAAEALSTSGQTRTGDEN